MLVAATVTGMMKVVGIEAMSLGQWVNLDTTLGDFSISLRPVSCGKYECSQPPRRGEEVNVIPETGLNGCFFLRECLT